MKMFMVAIALAAVTVACDINHGKVVTNTHPKVNVELLTEFEGVKLYQIFQENRDTIFVAVGPTTNQTTHFIASEDATTRVMVSTVK